MTLFVSKNKLTTFVFVTILVSSLIGLNQNHQKAYSQDNPAEMEIQKKDDLTINLLQNGQGLFNLEKRPNRKIQFASVIIKSDGKTDIVFKLEDGNLVRFGGNQTKKDAYSITIELSNSGMADASGLMNVEYGANNSIKHIFGEGKLDGQKFLVNFSN